MDSKESPQTILVVDDDDMMRWTLVQYLENKGYKIIQAQGGNSAIKTLQEGAVDLVISDIQMPDGDGFHLMKNLRSLPSHPPLIFMSGGLGLTESDLKEFGASHFLQKPIAPDDLIEAIQSVIGKAA